MLRFTLLIALVGLAVAQELNWDSIPVIANSSQCMYRPENKMLGCRGSGEVIECEAVSTLPVGFEVFGLGRETLEQVPVESQKFLLYPRASNETVYQNHVVEVENVTRNVSLCHMESMEIGLRVPDVKCWARLVELFNASVGTQVVQVEQLEDDVALFGEVLVVDKKAQKRFLGFGLLGWPLMHPLFWGMPFFG
ncbi:hypothetical protein BpHYR1_050502 [Brachionus plicatilis]|uniref:Uncharacterized protein n=1 Tax=Brachionus plicatilis TaxID=10195 RepID=A0A3M7S8H8_BRAPC|nr:hypothetical protein BpHYR1_050502 [Brachionus plicatilis]